MRYQVRPVQWGYGHRRFQVVDGANEVVLATLLTRENAEDEVIVLNLNVKDRVADHPHLRTSSGVAVEPGEPAPSRKCGRCRADFPADPLRHPVAIADWWICDDCREVLLGSGRLVPATAVRSGD